MTSNHKDPSTMTTHKDTLLELADRCEQASGPDRGLDYAIFLSCGWVRKGGFWSGEYFERNGRRLWLTDKRLPAPTASLDAAMTLVPEGWFWRVGHSTLYAGWAGLNAKHPDHCNSEDEYFAKAATTALALCAASLRARAAQ